jgi:hypothetical protein
VKNPHFTNYAGLIPSTKELELRGMKPFGYLAMAIFSFYAAYRYVIQARSIR